MLPRWLINGLIGVVTSGCFDGEHPGSFFLQQQHTATPTSSTRRRMPAPPATKPIIRAAKRKSNGSDGKCLSDCFLLITNEHMEFIHGYLSILSAYKGKYKKSIEIYFTNHTAYLTYTSFLQIHKLTYNVITYEKYCNNILLIY